MKCPKCNQEMAEGEFFLSNSVIGFLLFGFSFKNLYFTDKFKTKHQLLNNNEVVKGSYCKSCNLSIYSSYKKDYEDNGKKCWRCGTISYHGGNICISCGKPI